MKNSWISKGLLLLACLPVLAFQQEPQTDPSQKERPAEAEADSELGELGRELEAIVKNLRAFQPGMALEELKQSELPEPLVQFLRGWSFHQQGNYEESLKHFNKVGKQDLANDPYFANRLMELTKTAEALKSFSVYESENFSLRYEKGRDEVMLLFLPDLLEQVYAGFSKMFNFVRDEKIVVELMPDYRLFSYASALSKDQIETTGTIALCVENRLVVLTPRRVARGYFWPDVIAHEFVHYIVTKLSEDNVPLWMHEGIAKYFESRWQEQVVNPLDPGLETSLALAVREDSLLTVDQMMPSFAALPTALLARQAYAQTTSMIGYMCELAGEDVVNRLVVGLRGSGEMDAVMLQNFEQDFAGFEKNWRQWLARQDYKIHEDAVAEGVSLLDKDQQTEQIAELGEEDQSHKKHLRLGDLLLERSRYEAALKQYFKCVDPTKKMSRQIVLRMLKCHQQLGQFEAMSTLIDRKIINLNQDPTMLIYKARARFALEDFSAGEGLLKRAIQINPFNPEVFRLLLGLEKEPPDPLAVEKYKRALEILANPISGPNGERKS